MRRRWNLCNCGIDNLLKSRLITNLSSCGLRLHVHHLLPFWRHGWAEDSNQFCKCITNYLLTYLLNSWSRVHLEKLIGFQLVKKFPSFYGTRRFITSFTSARNLSLSWAISIQSIPPHPTSWRSILILSYHLRLDLSSGPFSLRFPHQNLCIPKWITH